MICKTIEYLLKGNFKIIARDSTTEFQIDVKIVIKNSKARTKNNYEYKFTNEIHILHGIFLQKCNELGYSIRPVVSHI